MSTYCYRKAHNNNKLLMWLALVAARVEGIVFCLLSSPPAACPVQAQDLCLSFRYLKNTCSKPKCQLHYVQLGKVNTFDNFRKIYLPNSEVKRSKELPFWEAFRGT